MGVAVQRTWSRHDIQARAGLGKYRLQMRSGRRSLLWPGSFVVVVVGGRYSWLWLLLLLLLVAWNSSTGHDRCCWCVDGVVLVRRLLAAPGRAFWPAWDGWIGWLTDTLFKAIDCQSPIQCRSRIQSQAKAAGLGLCACGESDGERHVRRNKAFNRRDGAISLGGGSVLVFITNEKKEKKKKRERERWGSIVSEDVYLSIYVMYV